MQTENQRRKSPGQVTWIECFAATGCACQYARRSGLGPVACRHHLTSDGIKADQLKRAFGRRSLSSVHFNENLAAIRHRAQEANNVALKDEAFPRLRGSPALFNRRLFVDPVYDLHFNISGLFPEARRGNYQLGALGDNEW